MSKGGMAMDSVVRRQSRPSEEGGPRGLERYKWHRILGRLAFSARECDLQATVSESYKHNNTQEMIFEGKLICMS